MAMYTDATIICRKSIIFLWSIFPVMQGLVAMETTLVILMPLLRSDRLVFQVI